MYQGLLLWWNYTMATRLGIRMKVHMRRDVGITTSSQSHTNVAETLCETLFVLCHFMVDHVDIAPSREVPNPVFFFFEDWRWRSIAILWLKEWSSQPRKVWPVIQPHVCMICVCLFGFLDLSWDSTYSWQQLTWWRATTVTWGCSYLPIRELLYSDVLVCVCMHSIITYMNVLLIYMQ